MKTLPTAKRIFVGSLVVFALTLLFGPGGRACFAAVLFDDQTDTISVNGDTTLSTAATIEARVFFTTNYAGEGFVFNEWTFSAESKALRAGPESISGHVFPVHGTDSILALQSVASNQCHHVAYVYDGSEERLYLDGVRIGARAASGSIGNGSGTPHIGAIFRDGTINNSFIGYSDFLRVSDIARYSGPIAAVPSPDVGTDANTQLLYRFNEAPGSITTVTDWSGNGHTGTLGTGFTGATAPEFVPDPNANADLVSLVPSPGTLASGFDPATTSYIASVPDTTTSMTVTPTASNPTATIQVRVNGGSFSAVGSGSASAALPLDPGVNTIDVNGGDPAACACARVPLRARLPRERGSRGRLSSIRPGIFTSAPHSEHRARGRKSARRDDATW